MRCAWEQRLFVSQVAMASRISRGMRGQGKSPAMERYLLRCRVQTADRLWHVRASRACRFLWAVLAGRGEGLCKKVVKGRVNESSGWKVTSSVTLFDVVGLFRR